ncbi:MAG: M90 family metallopeptidase [Acidimicrobiales bacterium]
MRSWRRRARPALPDDWRDVVAGRVAHWALLDATERDRLGELMADLVATKRWEAARGFVLTDEVRTVIAAQAALLVLGLDAGCYHDIGSIIVHPTTMRFGRTHTGPAGTVGHGPRPVVGQANHRGPVVIAWDAARVGARHPERGHDVVLHEFAHKLDMLDDVVDGTPPLPDAEARRRWFRVCTAEMARLRAGEGSPLLRTYAATNPAEFFAVATEAFFDKPVELEADVAELYGVLRDFYRQDPAARARRAIAG